MKNLLLIFSLLLIVTPIFAQFLYDDSYDPTLDDADYWLDDPAPHDPAMDDPTLDDPDYWLDDPTDGDPWLNDSDGDGYYQEDEFPYDPNEWEDLDQDNIGDNSDPFVSGYDAAIFNLESFYESVTNNSITISVTPTLPDDGRAEYVYQWYFNDFPIPSFLNGTENSYTIEGSTEGNGTWKISVTNMSGVITYHEFEYRVFTDGDSDGLSDYRESNILGTDPNLEDSDSDGLNDYVELNTHSTDPTLSDTDSDGLNDGEELNTYSTNPNEIDSDEDGLSDSAEVFTQMTDPNDSDSDDDGLSDGIEINTYLSNALAADTSGDGFSDGELAGAGFSPLVDYSNLVIMSRQGMVDLRLDSTITEVSNNQATVQIQMEESSDLNSWTEIGEPATMVIPADAGTKFFRFKMAE